ncbi:MAG: Tn3 family transposase [Solirubrobacteraceae bacterium]
MITLLDFGYRPQLADLPDSKPWRIDQAADYGPLNQAARGNTDPARIRRHWPDIQRLFVSIQTGAIPASDALRILAPAAR